MSSVLTSRKSNDDIRVGQLLPKIDWALFLATVGLCIMGLLMIYWATLPKAELTGVDPFSLVKRQGLALLLGVTLCAAFMFIDYRTYSSWAPIFFAVTIVLLIAVFFFGKDSHGAKAWLRIPLVPLQIQPSEFAKISLILMLSAHFHEYREEGLGLRALLEALGIAIIPMLLILAQPDLGTFLVFVAAVAGILLVARVRWVFMGALTALGMLSVWLVFQLNIMKEYQLKRLTSFLNPDEAKPADIYNVKQAQIAVGNGGWFGAGADKATQTSSGFVPENQNDFIFSVVGEQTGFVGAMVLLALYAIVFWRIFVIASRSRDMLGTLLCTGVICVLLFHMMISIGMTIGVMPVTGLPLLFVSYGGTAMMSAWMLIGIVQSVHIHRVI